MTENSHDDKAVLGHDDWRTPRPMARRPQVWVIALAALALAACGPALRHTYLRPAIEC
jgi:hypothetical protein